MTSRKKTFPALFGLIILGVLTINTPVDAANKKVFWASYGVEPCSKVLSTHARMTVKDNKVSGPPEVWSLIGWISGFATAANSVIGSPPNYFKAMTDIDIVNWVASFCRDNPNHDLDYAMRTLATDYRPF